MPLNYYIERVVNLVCPVAVLVALASLAGVL